MARHSERNSERHADMNAPDASPPLAASSAWSGSLFHRVSFRALLVGAFLLVAALLTTASVRGLVTLEALITESRHGAERAVADTAAVQRLGERAIEMERAARQYLVLGDPLLHDRFAAAARDASQTVDTLHADGLPDTAAASWREVADSISERLAGPLSSNRDLDLALTDAFRAIAASDDRIASAVNQAIQARNDVLRHQLEDGRLALARQLLGAITVSLVLAIVFSLALARPLKRVVRSIEALGANRLDQPIAISGPADVRQVGGSLEALRQRLVKLDSDKARFLRHVSHELKTPLAALREGVSVLEDGVTGALNEGQREVARILRHNTQVLQSQIEDLLRFNAAVFEAQNMKRSRVELSALIRDVADEQRLQAQARQLTVAVDGGPVWAEVDADKMATTLGNLLSNAIRFSTPGGTIRFDVSDDDRAARIHLVDAGPGVAEPDRDRIFEPFYRGERQPKNASRGSGIGLSIVHEYVVAHGGHIALQASSTGAAFEIELPHARTE